VLLQRRIAVAATLAVFELTAAKAHGQAIERNVAPGLQAPPAAVLVGPDLVLNKDETPLGPRLEQIVLIGLGGSPPTDAAGDVLVDAVGPPKPDDLAADLTAFIGQPMSRRLLSDVESAIIRHYRRAGLPFVAVSLPPQDVTQGSVKVRVVLFKLGQLNVSGAKNATEVLGAVRSRAGEPIDAPRLEEDLNWLNHSPFRQATASFAKGASTGETDLTIAVQEQKPWQVFFAWANSGSATTGLDRYIVGGQVGDLIRTGSLVSFEATASDDVWRHGDDPFSDSTHLRYLSHSLVAAAPTGPRQDLTMVANVVQTRSHVKDFDILANTEELSLVYRAALSNFSPMAGDLSVGLEAHGQQRETLFGDIPVVKTHANVFQALAGWSHGWTDEGGAHHNLSTILRYAPGGQGARNSDAAMASITNGRVTHAEFAYLQATYSFDQPLPAGLRLSLAMTGQLSNRPLPATEQIAIGGGPSVRAYAYDDQSFDQGLILRNQLRAPGRSLIGPVIGKADQISPYIFVDAGYGWNRDHTPGGRAIGAGVGADYQLGSHLSAGLTAAWALKSASYTREGHFKVLAHVTVSM